MTTLGRDDERLGLDAKQLSELVRHVKHYLGPDWGDPEGAEHQRTFLIMAINHIAGARDSFREAWEQKAARCAALETALRELTDAWQQRIAISERDVAAGEYSQAGCDSERGKRCVLRECIGEVRALLSAEPPAPKEG